jgi:DNA polymerase-1
MSLYGGVELPDRPDPENVRRLDLLPIPMVRKIMRYGWRIDPDHFRELSSRLTARMAELRSDITNEIPPEALDRFLEVTDGAEDDDEIAELPDQGFNVESSARIASLLYDTLGLHRTAGVKVKKTKGGDRFSTGKKTLEQLKLQHPVVSLILSYREHSKLESTYARALPRIARFHPKGKDCPECGRFHSTDEYRVHTQILTTRTATGRTASKKPNLGNIPVRSQLGAEIRAGFIASEGHKIVDRDWSQIELRLLAHLSRDPVLLEVYRNDGDVHETTAFGLFGSIESSSNPVARRICAKTCNFSIVYGTTEIGLYEQLCDSFSRVKVPYPDWLTEAGCKAKIDGWFDFYTGAKAYLDAEESKIRRYGIAWTQCGRVRRIPEVKSYHSHIQSAGVRQGNNHGIQGGSADLMRLALGELGDRFDLLREYGIETFPLMTIYDQILTEVPEDDAETVNAATEEIMDNVMVDRSTGMNLCRVPIRSDGKIMSHWVKE